MRVEDLTKFEGECPNIVVFGTYMDIRVPLTKKWKKIINERGDKPNTYHNCLISYISEQIALSGFNMKSIGNLLIKGIVFNQNDYYKYNDVGGFPATINDLGYWDKNRVELNEDFHTVRLFNTVSVYGLMFGPIKQNNFEGDWKEDCAKIIDNEVKSIGMWMWGDVKGYVLEKKVAFTKKYKDESREDEDCEEWEEVDSCWGCYEETDELIKEVMIENGLEE